MSSGSDADKNLVDAALRADDGLDKKSTNQWGLWPASGKSRSTDWHELIHYWFVRYNPLYFFSAFCVLAGVYLLTLELDGNGVAGVQNNWSLGQIVLFAVIQLYELLLIAAAGFLVHKVGLIRPAIILTILEGVFLFDCTFRLETISHLGSVGTALSVVWAVLVPVKAGLLGKALRIDLPHVVTLLVAGGAAGLAIMVQALSMPDIDRAMTILVATWWGAGLFALAVILKPSISGPDTFSVASANVAKRIAKSLLMLVGGMYFYHVLNYVAWIGVDEGRVIGPMIGTAFLMVALFRSSEREIWMGTGLSLIGSFTFPQTTFPLCVLAAAVLLYRAWQTGNMRFVVGAVLIAYFATCVFPWDGGRILSPPVWSTVVTGGLLAYLAWKTHEPTAFLALAVGGLGIAGRYDFNLLILFPQTRLGTGILLIVAGFVAITVGVWVNWWFRSPTRQIDHGEDETDALVEGGRAGG